MVWPWIIGVTITIGVSMTVSTIALNRLENQEQLPSVQTKRKKGTKLKI